MSKKAKAKAKGIVVYTDNVSSIFIANGEDASVNDDQLLTIWNRKGNVIAQFRRWESWADGNQ